MEEKEKDIDRFAEAEIKFSAIEEKLANQSKTIEEIVKQLKEKEQEIITQKEVIKNFKEIINTSTEEKVEKFDLNKSLVDEYKKGR